MSFVFNSNNEILVVKENKNKHRHWKIPGGALDLYEDISVGACREVKEETGIECKFIGILCVRHITKFRFNNTHDITFLCVLIPDRIYDTVLCNLHTFVLFLVS